MLHRPLRLGLVCVFAITATARGSVDAEAENQARLDAAMAAFNVRMTEAGWESQGPREDEPDTSAPPDAELGVDLGEQFAACYGDLASVVGTGGDKHPGILSTSESEAFRSGTGPDSNSTSETSDFNGSAEQVLAMAATIADEYVQDIGDAVDRMGDRATADCVRGTFNDAAESANEGTGLGLQLDSLLAEHLDVGDHSSSLTLTMTITGPFRVTASGSVVVAQRGNYLVAIVRSSTGGPISDFDPVAELQGIIHALVS